MPVFSTLSVLPGFSTLIMVLDDNLQCIIKTKIINRDFIAQFSDCKAVLMGSDISGVLLCCFFFQILVFKQLLELSLLLFMIP